MCASLLQIIDSSGLRPCQRIVHNLLKVYLLYKAISGFLGAEVMEKSGVNVSRQHPIY